MKKELKKIGIFLTLCVLLGLTACRKKEPAKNDDENNSVTQSQQQENPETAGDVTDAGKNQPFGAEKAYTTPQVADGYVLVREEPHAARHTVYWYDSDGRVVEHDLMDLEDSSKVEVHFIYEYQDQEDGSCLVTCTAQEDSPIAASGYEYLYDADGRLLSKTTFYKEDEKSETPLETHTDEYTYDEKGRLVRTTYENGSYNTFEYDENGNLTREAEYLKDGTECRYWEYTLDENGHTIHEHSLVYGDESDWDWDWSYLWDESGRLTELKALGDQGPTKFLQHYEYDESGNLVKIEDVYDCSDNLMKIEAEYGSITRYYAPLADAVMP